MFKIKINNAKTYLPSSMRSGTMEQRFQKARLMNLRFYDNLQDSFRDREVAPRTFAKVLRESSHKDISVEIFESPKEKSSLLTHKLNKNAENKGYIMFLPFNYLTQKIHKNNAPIFLRETQNFFNEIFNPKIFKRATSLTKNLTLSPKVLEFYAQKVSGTSNFSKLELEAFLSEINNKKLQIDALQYLRYKLQCEQNTSKAAFQIDRSIEKHGGFKYVKPDNAYSQEKYHYEDKMQIIKDKLIDLINSERNLSKKP